MRICAGSVMILMAYDSRAAMMTVVDFVCTYDVYPRYRLTYNNNTVLAPLLMLLMCIVDQQFLVCTYYYTSLPTSRYNI